RRQPERADRRARRREAEPPRSVRRVAVPARAQPQAGDRRAARSLDRAVGRRDPVAPAAPREHRGPGQRAALIESLVVMGHPPRREALVLAGARDFLLRIRALVQLTGRRRFDQLTFEIQEAIAPALYPHAVPHEGDIRPAVAPAVEALMSDYYLHARGVVQV